MNPKENREASPNLILVHFRGDWKRKRKIKAKKKKKRVCFWCSCWCWCCGCVSIFVVFSLICGSRMGCVAYIWD